MANTIQIRRGANASLPTLNAGEPAFSTDTKQVYIGDGVTNYELQKALVSGTTIKTINSTSLLGSGDIAVAGTLPTGWDTVMYAPKTDDATAITIAAGGQFTTPDGTLKTFSAAFDLDINDDLTTDDTLTADTWYHIWSNGTTTKFAETGTTAPSDVTNGVKLRGGVSIWNDAGTLKIRPFRYDGLWYQYLTSILLYDATMPTTNTTINLSAYVPANVRRGGFRIRGNYIGETTTYATGAAVYVDEIAVAAGNFYNSTSLSHDVLAGLFPATITRSLDFRCTAAYPAGKLWLQEWRI